jgi:type II secretory pathway component GspD/PulD (secretin)
MAVGYYQSVRSFVAWGGPKSLLWLAVIASCQPACAEPPAVPKPSNDVQLAEAAPVEESIRDKMVRLEFREQNWQSVLEWLARQKGLNLDWQQLPDGTLNLASATEYSVDEAEDLINMQLLARGFTLLQRGVVLRLVPLKNIDVTLVPRVTPAELSKLPRHRFVRVTFPLTWMIAEEAANELKPLISSYGQLFPMASSNRLEAMDAVVNLREVQRLLTDAESDQTRRERVAEFHLKHRKAEEVAPKVRQLLGLPPDTRPSAAPVQTQLEIETAKFRSEAVKKLGANAQPFLKDKPDVHLVVNVEENSILVNGRPDKIEIARQAIEAMDKPEPPRESSWETMNRIKIYPITGFDPAAVTKLVESLKESGSIDKETRIQQEAAYNRLVVFASPNDHVTIAGIIENLRTERRQAHVLYLGQIDAGYATKAIKLILKSPDRPSSASGAASDGKFQIEPDPSHKRLLLWATPTELDEVREFLAGLGETHASNTFTPQLQVVPLRGLKAVDVAERLKRLWKEISDVPLIIEAEQAESRLPDQPAKPDAPAAPAAEINQGHQSMNDRIVAHPTVRLAAQEQSISPKSENTPAKRPLPTRPPAVTQEGSSVHIVAGKDDELVIVSRDQAAAEVAKQLVEQVVPDASDVQAISLKHAQAAFVKEQVDDFLAHTRTDQFSPLDSHEPIVVEADSRTNQLMIQHATPRQLRLINELVPMLDQPVQEDKQLIRKQQVYHAQRKRASEIALMVKDVYRDLLSTSDKLFDSRPGYRPYGYNTALAATSKSPEYQGLLSVAADDAGNMVVVSAPSYLLDEVMQLVMQIDKNAEEEKVAVVPVSRAAHANVGEALGKLLSKPK